MSWYNFDDFMRWLNPALLMPGALDVVSNFADGGLFLIHGEAMLEHLVKEAGVDHQRESGLSLCIPFRWPKTRHALPSKKHMH